MSPEHSSHENNQELIKRNFEAQEEVMRKIYAQGARQYFESLPDLPKAFVPHDRWVRCMDDRTEGGYHIAGSGIIYDEKEALDLFRAAYIEGIASHSGGCGGSKYAADKNGETGDPDEYGRRWAKNMADKLDLPHEHSEFKTDHNARLCCYDGTARFNRNGVKGLLPCFIISRGIMDKDKSIFQAEFSVQIATGEHGFGELITEQKPFVIIVVGKTENEMEELKKELDQIRNKFGDKVKIDGFIAPKFE